jgi:hypothetical protein
VGIASQRLIAHAHDRALAELALDLRERPLKGGVARLCCLLLVGHGHGFTPPVEDGSIKLEIASDGTLVRIVSAGRGRGDEPTGLGAEERRARPGLGGEEKRFRYEQVPDELRQWTT